MGGYGWIWEDKSPMGGPRGVPGGSQGGPRGVPGGQTISHHSDCPFCGVKVKNPSQNIKKTKAPAPRQHNLMYRAINASRHQSSRRGAFTLVFLMFLLGKKVHFVEWKLRIQTETSKRLRRQHLDNILYWFLQSTRASLLCPRGYNNKRQLLRRHHLVEAKWCFRSENQLLRRETEGATIGGTQQ